MLIKDVCDPIHAIVDFVYPSFLLELQSTKINIYVYQRVVLTPANEEISQINEYMFNQMFEDLHTYLSSDNYAT